LIHSTDITNSFTKSQIHSQHIITNLFTETFTNTFTYTFTNQQHPQIIKKNQEKLKQIKIHIVVCHPATGQPPILPLAGHPSRRLPSSWIWMGGG
jgi:molybdopterin biosynthesis enzyme MoaB